MKRIFWAIACVLGCSMATAQNPYLAIQGVTTTGDGIVVEQPRSTLAVDLTALREVIYSGPYARYAQKFLGVRAPLTDKTTWTITAANIALLSPESYYAPAAPAAATSRVVSHATSDEEFARLQPDKTDMTTPALEDAARNAATQIFALRRHRIELVTGEAGENVFGEGLKSALAEIDRLEQSYLELFLGKRVLTSVSRRYVVNPEAGKKQYIVCRFNAAGGLLPESDLSGDMVVLQIDPSGATATDIEATKRETSALTCRVADPAVCTVIAGGVEYGRSVLPIFEMGRTISVPMPRR